MSDDEIDAIWDFRNGPFTDGEKAAMEIATLMANSTPDGEVDEALHARLKAAYTPGQIMEIAMVSATLSGMAKLLFTFDLAERATVAIGSRLGLESGLRLAEELAAKLKRYRDAATRGDGRAILPINLGDARHYRAFGSDSMFGEVLKRLGLTNAWQGASAYSAMAPVGIETLASMSDVWIILIPPQPDDAMAPLSTSAFWTALPAVRERRVLTLGSVNPYGALPAAARFAYLLMDGLTHAWNG